MGEDEIFDALGVTPEDTAAEGAKEQEVAEPAAWEVRSGQEGEKEQGVADPAKPEGIEDHGAEGEPGEPGVKEAQTPDERAQHAAERRRQEQQNAINAAVEQAIEQERERAKQDMAAFFQRAQLKNTITGKPITTMDEFNEWETAFNEAKLKRDLKAGKLTPEAVQKLIEQTPAMKQVREIVQQDQNARQQERQAAAQAKVEQELQEIHKLDPSINSTEDLMKAPNAKEFYDMVKSGKTFLEAYRLVNFDSIVQKAAQSAAQAGKQQALNNTGSKAHLTATNGQRGAGASPVPADVMQMFREINPDASDAEIQAYYNKSYQQ